MPRIPDHQRLEQLLAEHGARLKALLHRYRLPQQGIDPDEVEQEVRIRLWRAVERDRSGEFRASYIQRVVASVVIDAVRRGRVRPSEPGNDDNGGMDVLEDFAPRPDQSASDDERMQILAGCLAEIPERRRIPIQLHLQGLGFRHIGELNGISEEAARKLVSRGMADLRQRLRESGVEGDKDD